MQFKPWHEQKLSQSFSYLKKSFHTATPLIQPDFCGLLMTEEQGSTVSASHVNQTVHFYFWYNNVFFFCSY